MTNLGRSALLATSFLAGLMAVATGPTALAHIMAAPNDLVDLGLRDSGIAHLDTIGGPVIVPPHSGPGMKGMKGMKGMASPNAMVPADTAVFATPPFTGTSYVFGQAPSGAGPSAGTIGFFDQQAGWPFIGLHEILLPDGRVLNYGTDTDAQGHVRGGDTFRYDIWDPKLGTSSTAHTLLPNVTNTDIFCSFQVMDWQTGEVLITGGDSGSVYRNNAGTNATTIFSPTANAIRSAGKMQYPRWYASVVAMPNGDMVTLGGYINSVAATIVPEVYNSTPNANWSAPTQKALGWTSPNWRTLANATSDAAFGLNQGGWFYPKAWTTPRGDIFLIANTGLMYSINPAAPGSITKLTGVADRGSLTMPTVMYAPGKLLSLRLIPDTKTNITRATGQLIDINGPQPVLTHTADLDQIRSWGTATVLADGRVAVTGGSTVPNSINSPSVVAVTTQIWNPATGVWTPAAVAKQPRLYHSIAMMLPDATVLIGAGGSPGPLQQNNAEIYYPPYLFLQDGSGQPAPRPTLVSAPTNLTIGQSITASVGPTDVISRVTLVRAGSVTHSTNIDQRFFDTPFSQSGSTLTITPPNNANVFIPGYYLLFAFQNGAPSVAKTIHVTPPASLLAYPVVAKAG